MNDNNDKLELDIRGQICPSCLLLALKEVTGNTEKIDSRELTVHVISDDRQATTTIPDAVQKMGFSSRIDKKDDGYHILIFKE